MAEYSKPKARFDDLQRELEELANLSQNGARSDEAAVAAMMSAARDELGDASQTADDLAAQEAATEMALSILAEKPGTRPIVVKYVASNEDVPDPRFLIVLFGDRGFLFDRNSGRTESIPLDHGGRTGPEREAAILESAKTAAARERLSAVYLIKR